MSAELTDIEAVTMAANLNADTVRKQQNEIQELQSRLSYVRGILSRFIAVPAVRMAVGTNHVKTCNCPMCFAVEELSHD